MSDRLCATVRRLRTAPNGEPITGSEAHVLLILASITTDWTHEARIAVETIAADMRLSKRRVQQILETLVKKGAVERVGHSVGGRTTNGDGIPNRYRICIAAGAETAPEAAEEPDKGATQFTLFDEARVQPSSPLPPKDAISGGARVQFEAEKGEVGFTHNSTDQDDQDRSPSGPSAPPPTPGQTVAERLEAALAALSEPGANGPAIAAGFYRTLFPLGEDQSFGQLCGRLGALARQGGGYGPLMQRLIELSGRRLSGDPLDYAVALGQQRINRGPPVALPAAASGGQTAGMPHYRTGFGARRVGATTAAGREA